MYFSTPSLHAAVLTTKAQQDAAHDLFVTSNAERQRTWVTDLLPSGTTVPSIDIPLRSIALSQNFDSYVSISFRGARPGWSTPLMVDTGNDCLIVPDYDVVAALPDFEKSYKILAADIAEPWGAKANLLQGPIQLPTPKGVHEIPDCIFYACKGLNSEGERTANFGAGCINPWRYEEVEGKQFEIKPPLAVDKSFPCAALQYAAAKSDGDPIVEEGSTLTLYNAAPDHYQMLDVVKDLSWMSVRPRSLSIDGQKTTWPGPVVPAPIAMVDTGGGPVFLSDPRSDVWTTIWPPKAEPPDWTASSYACTATASKLEITLGDDTKEYTYAIDTATFPPPAQGLTLVMCKMCYFMRGEHGLNIGGISALTNSILIDYASARVGFKATMPAIMTS